MRLWSLHPHSLDVQGLVALWREALLAQAVLSDQTKGYKHHPQLARFRQSPNPLAYIAQYLLAIHAEAERRDYHFNRAKIGEPQPVLPLSVTRGQLDYEWQHLQTKLAGRSPDWLASLPITARPEPHPLFYEVPGDSEPWEIHAFHSKRLRLDSEDLPKVRKRL